MRAKTQTSKRGFSNPKMEMREKARNFALLKKENDILRVYKRIETWLGKGDTNFNPLANKTM